MGWKSTAMIRRDQAELLISDYIKSISDGELADALESMGFGENPELPYCGCNFIITDE